MTLCPTCHQPVLLSNDPSQKPCPRCGKVVRWYPPIPATGVPARPRNHRPPNATSADEWCRGDST